MKTWAGTITCIASGLSSEAALPHLRAGKYLSRASCVVQGGPSGFRGSAYFPVTHPLALRRFPFFPLGDLRRLDVLATDWCVFDAIPSESL